MRACASCLVQVQAGLLVPQAGGGALCSHHPGIFPSCSEACNKTRKSLGPVS